MLYKITGTFTITKFKQGEVIETIKGKNRILNAGFNRLCQQHIGNGSLLEITSLEIGDDDTPVAGTDTALGNVVIDDIPRGSQSVAGLSTTISFFIPDIDLPNGTYRELGLRSNNILYTRALITPVYTKSANEDTRIDYTLTYSAVL